MAADRCPVCHQEDGRHWTIPHVAASLIRELTTYKVPEQDVAGLDDDQARAALDRRKRGPPKT
jgi:hypothetical protein